MYNRCSYYDGKQKYRIVRGTLQEYEIIADGMTSQKAVKEKYRELRAQGINTKGMFTWCYKEEEERK